MNILGSSWHRAWQPPDDGEIYEWAERAPLVLKGAYKPSGRFSVWVSRHIIAPLQALRAPQIRVVNLLKSTQTAGTLVADLWLYWTIANDPKGFQFNWSIDDIGKDHAESRINPTIDSNDFLRKQFVDDRHKNRTQERQFRNGEWAYVRGGTEKNLQAKSIPAQVNDEIWQWKSGRKAEADARLSQYQRDGTSKQLNVGQASEIIRDEQGNIVGDEWFTESMVKAVVFKWQVPCEKCGGYFFAKPEEEDEKGETIYRFKWDENGSNIRCVCPHCAHEMLDTDELKAKWNEGGRYVLSGTEKNQEPTLWRKDYPASNVTFIWGAFIWLRWQMLVDEYRIATSALKSGVTMPLKKFLQKRVPDFWDDQKRTYIPPVDIRVDDYSTSAEWVVGGAPVKHHRFMTVDVQKNATLFYVVIRAWAESGESRRLFRGRVNSFEEIESLQIRFGVKSHHVMFDVGYLQHTVLQECARHIEDKHAWGWFGLKGVKDEQSRGFTNPLDKIKTPRLYAPSVFPDLELGQHGKNVSEWVESLPAWPRKLYDQRKLRVPLVLWSNSLAYSILEKLRDGRGTRWTSPVEEAGQAEDKIYRQQLGAKVLRTVIDSRGVAQLRWENVTPNYPDHYYDCEVQQIVPAAQAGCLIGA